MTFPIFLATIIPLLFLIGLLKKESRMLMIFFCLGLVAFLLAGKINTVIANSLELSQQVITISLAPIVEEILKFLPLLVVFLLLKKDSGKFTILSYGMAIGIGFSIQENYLYLQQYQVLNKESVLILVVLRGISTSLMHGLTTAIAGFGLCVVKDYKYFTFNLTFGLIAFAILFHSLFNLYINSPLKILGLFIPLMIYILGMIILYSLEEKKLNR